MPVAQEKPTACDDRSPLNWAHAGTRLSRRPHSEPAREIATLRQLWTRQLGYVAAQGDVGASLDYIASHFAMDLTLRRHLAVIDVIAPYIRGRVLEWGCQHALDSCVYRMRFSDRVELYGCDFAPERAYAPFYEFSGLKYTRLTHPIRLDYDDEFFDVVTSNGVLEHVESDVDSVCEIFRKLKPGGTFAITCLPNAYSYTEAVQRWLGNRAHDRLYTIASAGRILREAGFEVIATSYQFMLPTMLNGFSPRAQAAYQRAHAIVWEANRVLEHVWPINKLASNLAIIAQKPNKRQS